MHGWNVIYGPKEIKGSWVYSAGTLLLTGATVELDLIGGLWSLSYEIRKRSCRQAILQYGVKKFTFVFNVFIYRPNNTLIT